MYKQLHHWSSHHHLFSHPTTKTQVVPPLARNRLLIRFRSRCFNSPGILEQLRICTRNAKVMMTIAMASMMCVCQWDIFLCPFMACIILFLTTNTFLIAELQPMPFEGARIIINKGLSEHFQISHTINMSSVTPPGYRFGATYVGTKRLSQTESYPVLLGDIDPSGNVSSHIIHAFNERVRGKCVSQFMDGKLAGLQMGTDYKGDNFTASGLLVNPDILTGTGLGVFQYLQNVTPSIDLGAEVVYQRGPAVPNGGMASELFTISWL